MLRQSIVRSETLQRSESIRFRGVAKQLYRPDGTPPEYKMIRTECLLDRQENSCCRWRRMPRTMNRTEND